MLAKIFNLIYRISSYTSRQDFNTRFWVPPGHFYSPYLSPEDISRQKLNFLPFPSTIPGINLRDKQQVKLLKRCGKFYSELPFPSIHKPGLKYFYNNDFYSYSDAIFYYFIIRHFKPKRIIEIGSGFSSALALDINHHFFNNKISLTFIEPYPKILFSLISKTDKKNCLILRKRVQECTSSIFRTLQNNDILFVDSSHVCKTGSDVNYILFNILPMINPGVLIHFHDIFYPFEYPTKWIKEGRNWTECYLLKAFLQYNNLYKIILFNTYLESFYKDHFKTKMSLCLKNKGGSIWIKKSKIPRGVKSNNIYLFK